MFHRIGPITLYPGGFRAERLYDDDMRVPDYVLKCVGFVCEVMHRDSSGIHGEPHATGFFVSVPSDVNPRYIHVYFVTAKHVAEDFEDKPVYFLVNDVITGTRKLSQVGDQWYLHPNDPTADLAVVEVGMDSQADFMSIALRDFVTPEMIWQEQVGIGDEVFFGLFTRAPSERRVLPLLRHGNIAMLPREQIQTDMGFADVHLVEARSIGGISGSPVFVRPTIRTNVETDEGAKTTILGVSAPFKLLGLMQSHWDVRESEINKSAIIQDRKRGVNLGIAVVVPAIKIIETLDRSELKKMRNTQDEAATKKHTPGMDSAKRSGDDPNERQITKGDFEAALKKASRKVDTSGKTH